MSNNFTYLIPWISSFDNNQREKGEYIYLIQRYNIWKRDEKRRESHVLDYVL